MSRAGVAAVAVALVFLLAVPSGRAALPTSGTSFTYQYNTYLQNGGGNYSGYSEQQTSTYTYHVRSVVGDNVTMDGSGSWQFSNSTTSYGGSWSEQFAYSDVTRLYTDGFDVLGNYTKPYVWFWIPTGLAVGQTLGILDENFTVVSLASTTWLWVFPPTPRVGVELDASGGFLRNDVYGVYDATYTDQYWFDPSSGFIIAEEYHEHDAGAFGSFDWVEQVFVTSATYALPIDYGQLVAAYLGIPGLFVAVIVAIRIYKAGPRPVGWSGPDGPHRVIVRRVRSARRVPAAVGDSPLTGTPYLRSTVRRALGLKNRAYVALGPSGVAGYYIFDRTAGVGSMAAVHPKILQTFQQMHKAKLVFVELPPGTDPTPPKGSIEVERFDVLELRNVRPVPYDPVRIRPLAPSQLGSALAMIREAMPVPGEDRNAVAAYEDGDLAFVCLGDMGEIVGAAMATVEGDEALLYGLTVSAESRGRGFGAQLTAARLTALAALGVRRVRVEIGRHNPAPRAIARRLGFEPIGTTIFFAPAQAIQRDVGPRGG